MEKFLSSFSDINNAKQNEGASTSKYGAEIVIVCIFILHDHICFQLRLRQKTNFGPRMYYLMSRSTLGCYFNFFSELAQLVHFLGQSFRSM